MHASGPPVAALWASEAAIYQRFGFGPASNVAGYEVAARAAFRPGVDLGADRVREVPGERAIDLVRPLYERYAAHRAGALSRDDAQWSEWVTDLPSLRRGRSALRWAVHPQGYVLFRHKPGYDERGPNGSIDVEDLVALTPQAHAALLRYVLDTDLVRWVSYDGAPDDPLPLLLANSREAVTKIRDALYVRLVDVPRALAQRRYRAAVDVVIEVVDDFCPWNAGRYRLVADEKGDATVTRTGDDADLTAGAVDLGAAYLGGTRLSRLADAGRVVERTPGAVSALTSALLSDREPRTLEVF
ncbi:sterol carrier protein domain-containing protein [Actinokineospora soli]|uniref:Sterol carrier protein domain-containing protein n=1 Tax=Actinokineospora soli TaxID=1048753 RepID=A0ABW2TIK5_9PSEU